METKHTKGEWIFKEDKVILSEERFIDLDLCSRQYTDKEEFKANGKLIAAAPLMLDKLISIVETIELTAKCGGFLDQQDIEVLEDAKEAIEKSTK